jgi:hypothetical protein
MLVAPWSGPSLPREQELVAFKSQLNSAWLLSGSGVVIGGGVAEIEGIWSDEPVRLRCLPKEVSLWP